MSTSRFAEMDIFKGPPTLVANASCLEIARRNQVQSPLLRLPAEIRNKIFDLALQLSPKSWSRESYVCWHDSCLVPDLSTRMWQHDSHIRWDRLHLSRASRQIFAETAHAYFAVHIYPVACATHYWYDELGYQRHSFTPSQIRAVQCIDIDATAFEGLEQEHIDAVSHTIHTLRFFPALRKLIITEAPWYVEHVEWYKEVFRDGVGNQDLEVVHEASYEGSYWWRWMNGGHYEVWSKSFLDDFVLELK